MLPLALEIVFTPGLITAIIALLTALISGTVALVAMGRASARAQAQSVAIAVEAASDAVAASKEAIKMVTEQLERSSHDYTNVVERLTAVESALTEEQGKTFQLTMQLGKMKKRITQLEEFIHAQGWEPPAPNGNI